MSKTRGKVSEPQHTTLHATALAETAGGQKSVLCRNTDTHERQFTGSLLNNSTKTKHSQAPMGIYRRDVVQLNQDQRQTLTAAQVYAAVSVHQKLMPDSDCRC